jgi:ribonucleotide monophosphatase NagD (HAD superfamily)
MEEILSSAGAPFVTDESKIIDIIGKDKEPQFIGNGYYTRSLSKVSKRITKRIYGKPR